MASIFTFDPDPPRVSSPWSTPRGVTPTLDGARNSRPHSALDSFSELSLSDKGQAQGLQAEPQDGPTEYKLHLLLRPRRSFRYMSTVNQVPGSYRSGASVSDISKRRRSRSPSSASNTRSVRPAASSHTYQHRLQQLTTQLLWRLQQSSSYHATACYDSSLSGKTNSMPFDHPVSDRTNLHPGLEHSKGALYEIGVSDDGTLVGLARDEMDESLQTLGAMAASLGCVVEVIRMIPVGECEWEEKIEVSHQARKTVQKSKLWVAEAYVKPSNSSRDTLQETKDVVGHAADQFKPAASFGESSWIPQMRVSLIGSTMCGKSSLLGTLTNSTLDNGRGKSRLSLLKHRHEIASGVTSSVAQELIGYSQHNDTETNAASVKIINCASEGVSSWADIHTSTRTRFVFLLDSAGHSRYRRTAVRSLIGWAPHWTLLCVAGDEVMDPICHQDHGNPLLGHSSVQGNRESDYDIASTHLKLCLDLGKPLVVVITKLDLATKNGLRMILAKLLSRLKHAGRKPVLLSEGNGTGAGVVPGMENDSHDVSSADLERIRRLIEDMQGDFKSTVPIVLTSAVRGTGTSKLHALLSQLPISCPVVPMRLESSSEEAAPTPLFQVDDFYDFSATSTHDARHLSSQDAVSDETLILSGYVQSGRIQVGMTLFLGPYSRVDMGIDSESSPRHESGNSATRAAMNVVNVNSHYRSVHHLEEERGNTTNREWRKVRVTSVRTLRLSVRVLLTDQVGTIGVVAADAASSLHRTRKGMVLVGLENSKRISGIVGDDKPRIIDAFPLTSHGCVAKIPFNASSCEIASKSDPADGTCETEIDDITSSLNIAPGSDALVCFMSVRAAAKIVSVHFCDDYDAGSFGSTGSTETRSSGHQRQHQQQHHCQHLDQQCRHLEAVFRFNTTSEFVTPGAQILVIPGSSGRGGAGLDGLVGRVVGALSD